MLKIRSISKILNHVFYIAAAALLLASLVLTVSQQPVLADPPVCPTGYMLTEPDEDDTTAPFCIPMKVTVCHRNNGGVGYSAVDVSINSVTSNEDWWENGHGQHTIEGGEVGFPEDAWSDFYARNGDFIAAYGDQDLVENNCAAPVVNTPVPTSTPVQPTSTPVDPTSTPVDPTSTPVDPTSTPEETDEPEPTATSTPDDPTGGDDPTPVPTLSIPVTGDGTSVVASTAVLIPVTGLDDMSTLNKLTFSGAGLLGLGLVLTGIRRKFDL